MLGGITAGRSFSLDASLNLPFLRRPVEPEIDSWIIKEWEEARSAPFSPGLGPANIKHFTLGGGCEKGSAVGVLQPPHDYGSAVCLISCSTVSCCNKDVTGHLRYVRRGRLTLGRSEDKPIWVKGLKTPFYINDTTRSGERRFEEFQF